MDNIKNPYGALPDLARAPPDLMPTPRSGADRMKVALSYAGLGKPSRRFVAGAAFSTLVMLAAKPRFAFRENGEMRPQKGASKDPDATYYHFFLVPLLSGFIFAQCL